MEIKDVKKFIEELDQDNILFDSHFYKRSGERPVNEGMARKFLSQLNKLEKIELGKGKNKFKLWFKMSRKYSFVLIIEVNEAAKILKVKSAWNTNRKWQKKLKQ